MIRLLLVLSLSLPLFLSACSKAAPPATEAMLHTVTSSRPIAELRARIEAEAKKRKFGVVATHDLPAMMKKKGVTFEGEVVVMEVCSPTHAKNVLTADLAISAALPCRISLYRVGDQTILATMAPSQMLEMFGHEELAPVAAEVQTALYEIMAAAAE